MADLRITQETAATALSGTELVRGVQSGANVKITVQQILDFALVGTTGAGNIVRSTAPTIAGGAHRGLVDFGLRSSGTGAFDLILANAENLSAERTLTLRVNNAARTLTVAGDATVSGSTSGTNTGDGFVSTTAVANNAAYSLLMVASTGDSTQAVKLGAALSYNPSTDVLTVAKLAGTVQGLVVTPTTGTFTLGAGKTLAVGNSLTLAGVADGYTLTVPGTGTAALIGTIQTFSVVQYVSGTQSSTNPGISLTPVAADTGLLLIGGSTAMANGTSMLLFQRNNVNIGDVAYNSGTGGVSYNTTSDYRTKEMVCQVWGALDQIKRLQPVSYHPAGSFDLATRPQSFLAHELAQVLPWAVTGTKDAVDAEGRPILQMVDLSKVVPLLTAGMIEMLARLDQIDHRLAA